MVLRLLAAIALYKANYFLELYFNWLFDCRHVFYFKEFFTLEVEHAGDDVGGELLNLRIQITHTTVIKTASSLNLVFGIYQFVL